MLLPRRSTSPGETRPISPGYAINNENAMSAKSQKEKNDVSNSDLAGSWALILGASSGFGEANALKLSSLGVNIIGVHLDRKATLPNVERIREQIKNRAAQNPFIST